MPNSFQLSYLGLLICVLTMLPQLALAVIAPGQDLVTPIVIFAGGQVLGAILCLPQLFWATRQK